MGVSNAQDLADIQGAEGSSPLEFAGEQYMIDFPQLYLDYQNGPLTVRLGNQQIAWGDLLFFRIMDVPNGLDLRRHSRQLSAAAAEQLFRRAAGRDLNNDELPLLQRHLPAFGGNPQHIRAAASRLTLTRARDLQSALAGVRG